MQAEGGLRRSWMMRSAAYIEVEAPPATIARGRFVRVESILCFVSCVFNCPHNRDLDQFGPLEFVAIVVQPRPTDNTCFKQHVAD